jgi:hypothetical protein
VHPPQPALDPQPGLIEVHHLRGGEVGAHPLHKPAQPVGQAGGHRRDRTFRDRDAEQLSQRGGGALFGQELPDVEIDDDRGDPRAVLHRRGHPLGGIGAGRGFASATSLDTLMLDRPHAHRRDVEHLPVFPTHFRRPTQIVAVAPATPRLVGDDLVGDRDRGQRRPRMPALPTMLAAAAFA